MRKIKTLTSCAGDNFSFRRGKEYEVSDETSKMLVRAGYAEDTGAGKEEPVTSVVDKTSGSDEPNASEPIVSTDLDTPDVMNSEREESV